MLLGKFKVGDRVICINDEVCLGEAYAPPLHRIYTVKKTVCSDPHPGWLQVKAEDNNDPPHSQHFKENHFEHYPVPHKPVTDEGAEEYEEIMALQESVNG